MPMRIDAAVQISRPQFIIEPAGAHRFAYIKRAQETGEELWRWPLEKPAERPLEAMGQLLDVSV